ncbi:beta-galactosidase 7-like [Quercus robur]|uniref:beta-galactosidase 7-like n=1 Tax=Quercus robur TaxID=38942 RepID=UPI002161E438|nr:beta-galactosidase 7-like [Quercus robur]
MWPDIIQKAKDGGLDAIESYVFWDRHEPQRRKYDFSGNLDFVKFFKLVQDAGLYAVLRIGPYVCAEWTYGGFPLWLHNLPGVQLRTDNEVYKNEMQTFTTKIVNMCKEANLFASQGGPIIIAQIENEYGNIMGPYGAAGKSYIQWCAKMAVSQNIGVPWIMCQQSDAPQPMINTCNGFYCDNFTPNNPKSPKVFTENWTGWFKNWGGKHPFRTAEDVAFSVARFFQTGGVFNNYYMYHGGTNFGRTAGGPYITTSYDYNAPLDEYGNFNQPKWGHLKDLHAALKLGEKILTTGNRTSKQYGNNVYLTTYTNANDGNRFCFLSNSDGSHDANVDLQQDGKYFVPAWSVSILENCNKEVYNTAKVNAQTSVMVKKQVGGSRHHKRLSWVWAPEAIKDTLTGKGRFKADLLLDQKQTTADSSDYLWYMTSVNMNGKSSSLENVTLRVRTQGHVLHAFVNRKFVGSQWGTNGKYSFVLEKPVSLKPGTNIITLLSATVGLANYGSFFDLVPVGIVGGPIELIGANSTWNISTNQWSYKVGLNGEANQLYNPNRAHLRRWKATQNVPVGRLMTWYKTTFKTPSGTDPVVVDLQGMGKGQAWVNGKSIGRYWPSFNADTNGCSDSCDYRGGYFSEKCVTNCGNPTQRWYHVPRSFLKNDGNTLILFEEFGGNPLNVSFQTVTVGTVCGNAYEGHELDLSCQGGQTISEIKFASYGDPQGKCGSFKKGSWEASSSFSVVENACIGRESCSVSVSSATFGTSNLGSVNGRLAVEAVC